MNLNLNHSVSNLTQNVFIKKETSMDQTAKTARSESKSKSTTKVHKSFRPKISDDLANDARYEEMKQNFNQRMLHVL